MRSFGRAGRRRQARARGAGRRSEVGELYRRRAARHNALRALWSVRETPPRDYRDWKLSDYAFYDALAQHLIANGVICEPDSREPWFISAAHDEGCLAETLAVFEQGVDLTLKELERRT